jgi:glycerol-3-phosphate acyltransferase PlsY
MPLAPGRWLLLITRKMNLLVDTGAVILGYLLGSIPSAYIVGRLIGKIDLRSHPDGRISASVVNKKLGAFPFLLVVVMDVGKGALAAVIAGFITDSLVVVLISGSAAVTGHNWSVFLKFKGGLGATVTYGVLVAIVWWQMLVAAAIGGVLYFTTHKSGLSTAVLIAVISIILMVQYLLGSGPLILVPYPIVLILLMLLKRFQIRVAPIKS